MTIRSGLTRAAAGLGCALITGMLLPAACSDASAPALRGPALRIVPLTDSVFEGDTIRLTAQVFSAAGSVDTTAAISWSVSDTALATHVSGATFALRRPGTVRITAASGTATASCDLAIGRLVVTRVELTPDSVQMGRTDRLEVAFRVLGQGDRVLTGRSVTFTSNDSMVAVIGGPGSIGSPNTAFLIAVGPGATTIQGSADGVTGTARVTVVAMDTAFTLTHYNDVALPALVAADSVSINGVREYDEVYADSGTLVLSGLLQRRYQLDVRYSQYHVFQVGDTVQRELRLRFRGEFDRGLITAVTDGNLSMLSEFIGPVLEHSATREPEGYLVHYSVPGDNIVLDLRYRRVAP